MRRYAILLIAILLPLHICAKRYVYPEYSLSQIQQIINESDHIIFRKGVYNVDDNTSWFVKSNKKLTFESGSRLDFTNTRAKQYESLFNIQGDNVVFEGLCFTSSSRCSRSVYGNGPRDGFSSLCTVIMIRGNNVKVLNSNIKNAEIAVSISSGNDIVINNLHGECAQTIFAYNCHNLFITNINSILTTNDVGDLDHHIYLKADCRKVKISNSHFIGGPSYAIQISGDYSNPSICPKGIKISNLVIEKSIRGVCVDLAHSDVTIYNVRASGVASSRGESFFLANRGGSVRILNSNFSDFNFIELETIAIKTFKKGSSIFKNCSFCFESEYVSAFSLYYLDELVVNNCDFYYYKTSLYDGFIARTNPDTQGVSMINIRNNSFYFNGISKSCFRFPTSLTKVYINNNNFYSWDIVKGRLLSSDSNNQAYILNNCSSSIFTQVKDAEDYDFNTITLRQQEKKCKMFYKKVK